MKASLLYIFTWVLYKDKMMAAASPVKVETQKIKKKKIMNRRLKVLHGLVIKLIRVKINLMYILNYSRV